MEAIAIRPWQDSERSLSALLGLRACHFLDAELLSFAWVGASCLASGEDGWDTLLGSVQIREIRGKTVQADRGVRRSLSQTSVFERPVRWMLEVIQLKGMLLVGVADETLKTNSLLGTSKCPSWGWEVSRKGVEPINGSSPLLPLSLDPEQHRLVLLLHFDHKRGIPRLELSLLRFDGRWEWHFLGSHDLSVSHRVKLRPAVSVDVGAAVRVLCSEVFTRQWLTSLP